MLSAHRRADRWQQLLKDHLRAWNAAGDWRARCRALLSPWEQVRLIWPTMRGKVRWTGYRSFAVASPVRHFPMIVVLRMTLIAGDQALDWQAGQEADRILTGIRGAAPRSYRAWSDSATSCPPIRSWPAQSAWWRP